jgi:hypothetical protein
MHACLQICRPLPLLLLLLLLLLLFFKISCCVYCVFAASRMDIIHHGTISSPARCSAAAQSPGAVLLPNQRHASWEA